MKAVLNLSGADFWHANVIGSNLHDAIGIISPEEEEGNLVAAIMAIAAEPKNWDQGIWPDRGYRPHAAPAVGGCGTAHCLAGWMQALLPLDHPLRKIDPESAGWVLAPRACAKGWFLPSVHPDLQARVDQVKAAL